MASIDPKTMKKSGFWLEKCEFLKVCACQSGIYLGQQQGIDLGDTLMPLLCFQLRNKVNLLAILLRTAVGNLKLAYTAVVDS